MAVSFLDLSRLHDPIKDELLEAVQEVVKSNQYILGPTVKNFESNFARQMKARHAVGVNSGTDALMMTLHALGIQPGEEVICPVYTFVATAEIVARLGANIVFVDVNQDFTIDIEAVRASITERTRAIIAVHLFGRAADVVALQQICSEFGLHLVEDCCQATGAEVNGQPVGTFGTAGCFSFYPTKNLGGFGDGGMIITNNEELANRVAIYRDHGRDSSGTFVDMGYNSRLDAIQAAMLNVKLQTLDEDNADRVANASFYDDHLNKDVFTLPAAGGEGEHVYNLYSVRHPNRDHVRSFLKERMIDTALYYPRPLHLEPCFAYLGYQAGHFPVAEQVSREIFQLPVAPGLTRKELDEVAHAMALYAQTYPAATAR